MKAFYETWSPTGENEGIWEIPTRNCTAEDWGINGKPKTNNDFDSPYEEDHAIYKRIMYSMRCFDQPLSILGDWDTATSKVLLLLFEKCDPNKRTTCKNDTDLNEFVKKKHFIFGFNKKLSCRMSFCKKK